MKSPEEVRELPKKSIEQMMEFVDFLLNNFSEEKSDKIIVDPEKFVTHKCQKGWFHNVVYAIDLVKEHLEYGGKLVDSELTSFLEFYTSEEFRDQSLVEREDIDRANKVLELSRRFLEELKKEEKL